MKPAIGLTSTSRTDQLGWLVLKALFHRQLTCSRITGYGQGFLQSGQYFFFVCFSLICRRKTWLQQRLPPKWSNRVEGSQHSKAVQMIFFLLFFGKGCSKNNSHDEMVSKLLPSVKVFHSMLLVVTIFMVWVVGKYIVFL